LAAALKRLDERNEQSGSQTCYKKYSNARFEIRRREQNCCSNNCQMYLARVNIIHEKILNSDWLRAVQVFRNTVQFSYFFIFKIS
jgi:hypothetical protein